MILTKKHKQKLVSKLTSGAPEIKRILERHGRHGWLGDSGAVGVSRDPQARFVFHLPRLQSAPARVQLIRKPISGAEIKTQPTSRGTVRLAGKRSKTQAWSMPALYRTSYGATICQISLTEASSLCLQSETWWQTANRPPLSPLHQR